MIGQKNVYSKMQRFNERIIKVDNYKKLVHLKCLSLRQPYAELVAQGRKTIETRRWNTNFRGKFLIHASKAIDKEISAFLNIDCSKLAKGAIIGIACLSSHENSRRTLRCQIG